MTLLACSTIGLGPAEHPRCQKKPVNYWPGFMLSLFSSFLLCQSHIFERSGKNMGNSESSKNYLEMKVKSNLLKSFSDFTALTVKMNFLDSTVDLGSRVIHSTSLA